jgi:hypothetical protein
MHFITLLKKKLGQISPILPCDAGNKCPQAVVHRRNSPLVSYYAHEKELRDGRLREPLSQANGSANIRKLARSSR